MLSGVSKKRRSNMSLEVMPTGKVYNNGREVGYKDRKGYVLINIGEGKSIKRCKLVAQTYLNWFEGCEVHHLDGDRSNDSPDNLACLTVSQHKIMHNKSKIIARLRDGAVDKVYKSITEAEREMGLPLNHSHISDCINGRQNSAYGFGWKAFEYPKVLVWAMLYYGEDALAPQILADCCQC